MEKKKTLAEWEAEIRANEELQALGVGDMVATLKREPQYKDYWRALEEENVTEQFTGVLERIKKTYVPPAEAPVESAGASPAPSVSHRPRRPRKK